MKRLLLVDDDTLILRSYRDRLSGHGFQVNTAADASTALAILRAGRPDLVVVDLMMQPLTGVDIIKFVRSEPRLAATPIIVLTNAFLNDLGRQAAALGIERAFLKAECSPSVLMAAIDELLEPRRASVEPSPLPTDSGLEPSAGPPAISEPTVAGTSVGILSGDARTDSPSESLESPQASGDLIDQALRICAELRKLHQLLSHAPQAGPEQAQHLKELYRRVHFLTGIAGLTQYRQVAQLASVFEALLYVLTDKPSLLGPSAQRTIANLVDFIELLFQHAREARLDVSRPAKVLAVDDDPLSNQLVVRVLREHDIQATSTDDPLVAWQWLQQQPYDLVLLDIEMPGLNGFELCKRLRMMPAHKRTPVLFVTSHSDFTHRAQSMLSGGDDLIAKPVLPLELTAKVLMHFLKSQLTA